MFQRGSKFYSKISSGGSIFSEKFVPVGTNFGGSIFAMTEPVDGFGQKKQPFCSLFSMV